jgi:flagellar hook-basal body complex protein FliE
MTVTIAGAAGAYANAAKPGLGLNSRDQGGGFGELVKDAIGGAVDAMKEGEATSMKALQGKADITEVVTAVSNAEVALQTVSAVRDRVVQAYQDLLRMPI